MDLKALSDIRNVSKQMPLSVPGNRAVPNQCTWKDLGLPDIRAFDPGDPPRGICEQPGALDLAASWEQVALGLGLKRGIDEIVLETPFLAVTVKRQHLLHIVEKRPNARERFIEFALDTLQNPLEIWRVSYSDGSFRLAYIGAYNAKYQMLAVINVDLGNLLWNFMNCDKKALNKHRHGELMYDRYQTSNARKQPG